MDKGMFPVLIYKYIKENSDEEKGLTTEDIYKLLRPYTPDIQEDSTWKTVSRNLEKLAYQFEEIRIVYKNGFEYTKDEKFSFSEIESIYYDQKFTTNDVRVISDAVIYSRHLNDKTRKELLGKIAELRPSHSNSWYRNALQDSSDQIGLETDLFHNLEYIDYAITDKRCIDFDVMMYGFDKKLHKAESHKGFIPYKIYITDGIYYVVGLHDKNRKATDYFSKKNPEREHEYPISRYPIHRLKNIRIDDEYTYLEIKETILKDKSLKEICEGDYNIYEYLTTPGRTPRPHENDVKFNTNKRGLNALTDIFGKRLSMQEIKSEEPALSESNTPKTIQRVTKSGKQITIPRTRFVAEQRFEVTLKNVKESDWNRIIALLIHYTVREIALISHQRTLENYITNINSHIIRKLPNVFIPENRPWNE